MSVSLSAAADDVLPSVVSLGQLLEWRAEQHPDRPALTFLRHGVPVEPTLTYRALRDRARALANELLQRGLSGERIGLLCQPGCEELTSIFACQLAHAVVVPLAPPRGSRNPGKFEAILADADVRAVLQSDDTPWTSQPVIVPNRSRETSPASPGKESWGRSSELAFLQYTSGSTETPRGVMISQANALSNLRYIHEWGGLRPDEIAVEWLPLFHDMGLLTALYAIYAGAHLVQLSPLEAVQQPHRWLAAISEYRAAFSGGPNFLYDLCARQLNPDAIAEWDLSRWRVAFCGAEPVRAKSLSNFAAAMARARFDASALLPCYGLAEFTVAVTGRPLAQGVKTLTVSRTQLSHGHVEIVTENHSESDRQTFVSCGRTGTGHEIRIVDSERCVSVDEGLVGEIWARGPSRGQGYWHREDSSTTFEARLTSGEGPFLRTGDLGFLHDGELYVCGRIKDLVIIRGVNHVPQDIEQTVEQAAAGVSPHGVVAFSVEGEQGEQLVIVAELSRPVADTSAIFTAIVDSIATRHDVSPQTVVLLKPGRLPRTTSGKLQRSACRAAFLNGPLPGTIAVWTAEERRIDGNASPTERRRVSAAEIQSWLQNLLAKELGCPPGDVDPAIEFQRFGLDSLRAVRLAGSLGEWLGDELSPTLAWDYPTIERLADFLARDTIATFDDDGPHVAVEPLALVGMSCRFAGAESLDAFLRLLQFGGDGVVETPPDRWNVETLYDPRPEAPGKTTTRWGGFLTNVDHFDAAFFGITPREAKRMDPQQRLLVETAWEALEHAGFPRSRFAGSNTGVYVGIGGYDYSTLQCQYPNHLTGIDAYTGTGNTHSIAANRLSYLFDLRGPSLACDTACSSGLLALHLACQAIRAGDCDQALAGAVNLILSPEVTIAFSKANMLSPDGRCHAFDAAANGYVRGEGCAVLVVKRLADAERDGDRILAVIRGSAANQDGRTSGITAPSGPAQQRCLRRAWRAAGIAPADVSYIEAHGTATPLGDPIELNALGELLPANPDSSPCFFGSAKANVGHTETVSGLAGVIKVTLMLQYRELFPQIHFETLNPHIQLQQTRLRLSSERQPWPDIRGRRLAGISSFGFGGTNVHVVLEGHAEHDAATQPVVRRPHVLTISAKSEPALRDVASRYRDALRDVPADQLADFCGSANAGRTPFPERLAVRGATADELSQQLAAFLSDQKIRTLTRGRAPESSPPKIAFLLTGQGAQHPGMARTLLDRAPVFREVLQTCDDQLRPLLGASIIDVACRSATDDVRVHQTRFTQPALFALEYALAKQWMAWGVVPCAVLGHSVGEYVAACLAGVFSLADALALVTERARLMDALPATGAMVAVLAAADEVRPWLAEIDGVLAIAADNGPHSVVVSGEKIAVACLVTRLRERQIGCQPLPVSHAFHSPLMEPMLAPFGAAAEKVVYQPPQLPIVSNVTGRLWEDGEVPSAKYWTQHVRQMVRFAEGLRALDELKPDIYLEIGPAPQLIGLGRTCLQTQAAWVGSLKPQVDDWAMVTEALATLFVRGALIDWAAVEQPRRIRRVPVPTYPFQRVRYWMDPPDSTASPLTAKTDEDQSAGPLLGHVVRAATASRLYETTLSLARWPWLIDHKIQSAVVMPAAAFLEMGLEAIRDTGREGAVLENVQFQEALLAPKQGMRTLQFVLNPEFAGVATFYISSQAVPQNGSQAVKWTQHVTGVIRRQEITNHIAAHDATDLHTERANCPIPVDITAFYAALSQHGLRYGPHFRGVQELWSGARSAVGRVVAPAALISDGDFSVFSPPLLDAAFHVLAAALPRASAGLYLPVGVRTMQLDSPPSASFWVTAQFVNDANPALITGHLKFFDDHGHLWGRVDGLQLRRLSTERESETEPTLKPERVDVVYRLDWERCDPPFITQSVDGNGRPWVIFSDSHGVSEQLAALFEQHGHGVKLLFQSDEASEPELSSWLTDREVSSCAGWIHLAGLGLPNSDGDLEEWVSNCVRSTASVATAVRLLSRLPASPRLVIVTQGALATSDSTAPIALSQSPLVGVTRTAVHEHQELRTRLIDLDPKLDAAAAAEQLWQELWGNDGENQIAWRDGVRSVPRLRRRELGIATDAAACGQPHQLPDADNYRLQVGVSATLDGLQWQTLERRTPPPGTVQIAVAATGLNFSDVLKAMKLYPGSTDDVMPLGIECAGTITAVGDGVAGWAVGDNVLALAPYCFSKTALCPVYGLIRKPAGLSFAEAATLPVAYLTAHYALLHLARLAPGESVLIHAAAGGVGQAAIQIARACGAMVFATAGTSEKRDFLLHQGIEHVFDSRSTQFADDILQATHGRGVDVVLNSLSGEAIPASLRTLTAYGRFLELGKTDIYLNRSLGLEPFQNNLSYFAIDMDRLYRQRPELMQRLIDELSTRIHDGSYPALPRTEFSQTEVVSAFRYLSQRKNIGKVIVTSVEAEREASPRRLVRADGCYLITGGLGHLGLQLADWLASRGATQLVLMSRGAPNAEQANRLERLRTRGVTVTSVMGDVTQFSDVERVLATIDQSAAPLLGVFHLAGQLDDGVLLQLTPIRFQRVMSPKICGAWNLHRATQQRPLDHFVLFSSAASLLGSSGQGNYAAANAFLDALAHERRRLGMAALSINWGPWESGGMADTPQRRDELARRGFRPLDTATAFAIFDGLLSGDDVQTAVMAVDWSVALAPFRQHVPAMVSEFSVPPSTEPADEQTEPLSELWALPPKSRVAALTEYFRLKLGQVTGLEPGSINITQPLNELGLDSLMVFELKNAIETRLQISIPLMRFFENPSLQQLAEWSLELHAENAHDRAE